MKKTTGRDVYVSPFHLFVHLFICASVLKPSTCPVNPMSVNPYVFLHVWSCVCPYVCHSSVYTGMSTHSPACTNICLSPVHLSVGLSTNRSVLDRPCLYIY